MAPRVGVAILLLVSSVLAGCTGDTDDEPYGPYPVTARPEASADAGAPWAPAGDDYGPYDYKPREQEDFAPPAEQREADCAEVDRAGEWCERAWRPRSEKKYASPVWEVGDRWRFETYVPLAAASMKCAMKHDNEVTAKGTSVDLPVYTITRTQYDYRECDRSVMHEMSANYTRADLVPLRDDGYVEHEMLFPLEDGKRWFYRTGSDVTVEGKMEFDPKFQYSGSLLPLNAWKVTLTYSEKGIQWFKYFGESDENYLLQELWADVDGKHTLVARITLQDS